GGAAGGGPPGGARGLAAARPAAPPPPATPAALASGGTLLGGDPARARLRDRRRGRSWRIGLRRGRCGRSRSTAGLCRGLGLLSGERFLRRRVRRIGLVELLFLLLVVLVLDGVVGVEID